MTLPERQYSPADSRRMEVAERTGCGSSDVREDLRPSRSRCADAVRTDAGERAIAVQRMRLFDLLALRHGCGFCR